MISRPHLASRAAFSLAVLALVCSLPAHAHISYSGRDFGSLADGSNVSIATQSVTSNYGWADASDDSLVFNAVLASTPRTDEAAFVSGTGTDDLYLGDSHKGKAFKLHLDSALSVTITASARNDSGLTPAFSLYQGLAATSPFTAPQTSADHDYAAASQAWRTTFAQSHAGVGYDYLATNGSWNAKGDWSLGGDGDPVGDASALSTFRFLAYGATTVANGTASTTLTLGPGDYTVFLGGNNIAGKSLADSTKAYAFTLGVSAVSAVPEPASAALLLMGLAGMGGLRLRRTRTRTAAAMALGLMALVPQAQASASSYSITTTWLEPQTQPRNTVFVGSFDYDSSTHTVSNLQGKLSEAMTNAGANLAYPNDSMVWLNLNYQLVSWYDSALAGTFAAAFKNSNTNTFYNADGTATDHWSPQVGVDNGAVYFGFPKSSSNPGNAYALIFVPDDPLTSLNQAQLNKLAYADCTPTSAGGMMMGGGMMGSVCMTGTSLAGYGMAGTMDGYPLSQTITAVPEPSSMALALLGLGFGCLVARRRHIL